MNVRQQDCTKWEAFIYRLFCEHKALESHTNEGTSVKNCSSPSLKAKATKFKIRIFNEKVLIWCPGMVLPLPRHLSSSLIYFCLQPWLQPCLQPCLQPWLQPCLQAWEHRTQCCSAARQISLKCKEGRGDCVLNSNRSSNKITSKGFISSNTLGGKSNVQNNEKT